MHYFPRRILTVPLVIIALLLTACQVPLPYIPVSPADDAALSTQDEAASTEAETEEPAPDTPSEDAVDDMAGSDDAVETEGSDVVSEGEETAPEEPEEAVAESQSMATIIVRSLRIRSGPGTEYDVVGGAGQGESFPILGQANNCEWLNVEHPALGSVWLSGLAEYTTMDTACVSADVAAPAEVSAPAAEQAATGEEAAVAEATPEPLQEPAEAQAEDDLPVDQGCYLIQNQLGPELNVTVTATDHEWSDNFQIGEDEEVPYCLAPGRYTVTIDAPPPWADLNDELTVQAGDRFFWPIRSGE